MLRANGRAHHQLRPITVSYQVFGYASGSVLFELGNTKVLCAVTLQTGVPPFLKGKRTGWLTAEYSLLPTSTQVRSSRDSSQMKKNDRAVEISRLIGRSLRAVVDLSTIGERTIFVDCDVLQADGSTRTAAITGSYLALRKAVSHWLARGDITQDIIKDSVAAVSVGWGDGKPLLDLDYQEDSQLSADYNVVLTGSDTIIEIQGTTEKDVLSWQQFNEMMLCAQQGVQSLFKVIEQDIQPVAASSRDSQTARVPLFSLQARLKQNQPT